jgi:RNA polymerase sigma-70 factor (ECF subfamily)
MLALAAANAPKSTPASRTATDFSRSLAALRPELYGRAVKLTGAPELAEDLVQDTIERAIRFADSFRAGTNLRAWVHEIMRNVFIDRYRRARRERRAMVRLTADPCAWTSHDEQRVMECLSPPVERALREVPKQFREVVVLVDIAEMSYIRAAKQLRVPIGTVMSRVHRGRKILREKVSVPERMRAAA